MLRRYRYEIILGVLILCALISTSFYLWLPDRRTAYGRLPLAD